MSYIERKDGIIFVKPGVDIIASQCAALKEEMLQIIKDGEKKFIIDLQDTQMIDSSGLGLLISTQNSIKDKGGEGIEFVNISDDIHKLFSAMRLDQHFKM
jgi:anti-anti-sigma factor